MSLDNGMYSSRFGIYRLRENFQLRVPFNCGSKAASPGFYGSALVWLSDYLKDRKQFAVINGYESKLNAVNCGIPQGSHLGPRLFFLC